MRHLCAAAAALLLLAGTAAAWVGLARSSPSPGTVWVLTRGQGAPFRALQALPGVKVLNHWDRGRIVQLQADSLAATHWPAGAVWLALPLPDRLFSLAACG